MRPEIERNSPTWKAIEALATESVEKLRLRNDSTANKETETAVIRGRISVWKEILALARDPEMDADDGSHGF